MLKKLSIVGYVGMIGGFLGLVALHAILSLSPIAISLQIAAFLLFIWARATLGWRSYHVAANPTEGGVVMSGPYRYIRHPIYAAFSVFAIVGIATHWSWSAGICGAVIVGSARLRMLCEEALVAAQYPEYRQYAKETWRIIPYIY